jgi:hypothetical protein
VIDLTERLGGTAVLTPRISGADPRERHLGISHHTLTVLKLASQSPLVPLSHHLKPEIRQQILTVAAQQHVLDRATWYEVEDPSAEGLFDKYGLKVRSMGRGVREDPAFFQSTVAAGFLAGITAAGELTRLKQVGENDE